MKNITTFVIAFTIFTFCSCKKDDTSISQTPISSGAKNTPNFVATHFKWDSNIGWWSEDGLIFYDLNHDKNIDKKFFIVTPSGKIIKAPSSIESEAVNWPAEVKSCGYGYNTDMYVNAHMRLRVTYRAADGRLVYLYDSIYHRPAGGPTYGGGIHSAFNDPAIAGIRAGKTPQGLTLVKVSGLPGGAIGWQFWSYFKESSYTGYLTGGGSGAYTSGGFGNILPGMPPYDWVNVNVTISYKDVTGWYTHVFFDFKNWRYFDWKEECVNNSDCSSIKVTFGGYKSLDEFMKWPEGWGKP